MSPTDLANCYYAAFRQQTDFSEVPFAADIRFHSPSGVTEGAAPFRGMLTGLAKNVKALTVRHQLSEGDDVITVYDFDMGLPGGAIPMAERLHCKGGEIVEAELFFDSKRLGG